MSGIADVAFIGVYFLLFVWLWGNWQVPGLQVASVGIGLNTLAVILNGGRMPIWSGAFNAAGFNLAALARDPFHELITTGSVSTSSPAAASSATSFPSRSRSSATS